jgi:protein-disulfide isomerase
MRHLIAIPLLAACWSNTNKNLETKVTTLTAELVHTRGQLESLDRKTRELAAASEQRTDLEVRLERLEKRLEAMAAPPPPPTLSPPPPPRAQLDPTKTYSITTTHGIVDGPADAKVTLVVADEYACPYCRKARATLADLKKKYGKNLRIVYKSFVVHPQHATSPALAICAAAKQRKHEKLDELLWTKGFDQRQFDVATQLPDGTTQSCWDHPDGCPVALGFAKEAKLDVARVKRDMAGTCVTELATMRAEWNTFNLNATPTFFINGRVLQGAMPIENFERLIDEEAQKADERIKKGTPKAKYYEKWVLDAGEKSP